LDLIIFSHPDFGYRQSMPRFAKMLVQGMRSKGHTVTEWKPEARFYKLPSPFLLKKWLGYIDQFILFPLTVRRRLRRQPPATLFVFCDNALGPWVPLVSGLPHCIHCHDFLAQQSALGLIPENRTGLTGRLYQAYIRNGFRQGKNFISVSAHTREQLQNLLIRQPIISEVVYNGMNKSCIPSSQEIARQKLGEVTGLALQDGYIMHVGGNQWYKNRQGVVQIYSAFRQMDDKSIPLLMIGEEPDRSLQEEYKKCKFNKDIYFITGMADENLQLAYQGASVLLFPSLAEGFGWPIAEAMASGCPVITTGEAPMTEVAGRAARLIPRKPHDNAAAIQWAIESAAVLAEVINMPAIDREEMQRAAQLNVVQFETGRAIDQIESIYKIIVLSSCR
jgi:glycosyltransferase involved in cell wall biosynthesis